MTQISILTSTKFATSKSLLVLTSSWPADELREILVVVLLHPSTNTRQEHTFNLPHHPSPWRNAARIRWGFGHCSWLVYQLVVTVRGSSLLPHQWLLYFPTCQVNIWKQALALEANCCSHSCDYGHKNNETLPFDDATLVGHSTVGLRGNLCCLMLWK